MRALSNPDDALVQANVLAAVELRVAAEHARARLLGGEGDADEVVRLEGAAARAERKLNLNERREHKAQSVKEWLAGRATRLGTSS
jgi:hypothetical protein